MIFRSATNLVHAFPVTWYWTESWVLRRAQTRRAFVARRLLAVVHTFRHSFSSSASLSCGYMIFRSATNLVHAFPVTWYWTESWVLRRAQTRRAFVARRLLAVVHTFRHSFSSSASLSCGYMIFRSATNLVHAFPVTWYWTESWVLRRAQTRRAFVARRLLAVVHTFRHSFSSSASLSCGYMIFRSATNLVHAFT